jgi:hypothetical protein
MSSVRLYVDEDASEMAVIVGLRARGVDLLTTLEAARLGTPDSDQLGYAVLVQRICRERVSTNFAGDLGPERYRLGVLPCAHRP